MAIIDLATAKTLMGVTTTTEDAKITLLANYADSAIKRYLGIDFEPGTYPGTVANGRGDSGYYSGNGKRYLFLRQRPVTVLTSIYLDSTGYWGQNPDGSFSVTTLLVAGTDYALATDGYIGSAAVSYQGIVERRNGVWPSLGVRRWGELLANEQPHKGNIKVSYQAGATPPADVVQAAALLIAYWRTVGPSGGGYQSESLGAYSFSFATVQGGMPDTVKRLLAPYKIPVFA